MMHSKIQRKLAGLAAKTPLAFLLAVESGSRAWGFPSLDSDYDVRTVFVRPRNAYLCITEPRDTFEYIYNQWFDVVGWDARKALSLLSRSNAVLFEWLQSPLVYTQDDVLVPELRALMADYFQAAAVVHHYRGIAKNALSGLDLRGQIRLKKWLYVLRPLLAARQAARQHRVPPMTLIELMEDLPVGQQARNQCTGGIKSHAKRKRPPLAVPRFAATHLAVVATGRGADAAIDTKIITTSPFG